MNSLGDSSIPSQPSQVHVSDPIVSGNQGKVALGPPAKITDQEIKQLANKLFKGDRLSQSELQSLKSLTEKKLGFFQRLGSGLFKVKIDRVRNDLLNKKGKIANTHKAMQKLESFGMLTVGSRRAMAKLLIAYDQSLQQAPSFGKAQKLLDKGQEVSENTLRECIQAHNKVAPPNIRLAGTLALGIGDRQVFYTKKGLLELAPPHKKTTIPIGMAKGNLNLDQPQVEQLKDVFKDVYEGTPYNNMSPMLEFVKFFKEAKESNPNLTLHQAYLAFNPSPEELFDKYQSGDCVIVAGKVHAAFQHMGVEAGVVGQFTRPPWADPPIPNNREGPAWPHYDKVTENVHHCAIALKYTSRSGEEKGLYMDPLFGSGEEIKEVDSYDDRNHGMKTLIAIDSRDTSENITNVGHILKMQMAGKTKMNLMGKAGMSQICGIDLLNGNIYLNGEGAKGLKGLPLGANGRFSIKLEDLKDPQATGNYIIVEGEAVQMSHREALEKFAEVAKDRFQLPDDFVGNMIVLAENAEEIVKTVLLPPAQTAKDTLKEANGAFAALKSVEPKSYEYARLASRNDTPEDIKKMAKEYQAKFTKMNAEFSKLQKAIVQDKPDDVRMLATEIGKLKGELVALCLVIENQSNDQDITIT